MLALGVKIRLVWKNNNFKLNAKEHKLLIKKTQQVIEFCLAFKTDGNDLGNLFTRDLIFTYCQ